MNITWKLAGVSIIAFGWVSTTRAEPFVLNNEIDSPPIAVASMSEEDLVEIKTAVPRTIDEAVNGRTITKTIMEHLSQEYRLGQLSFEHPDCRPYGKAKAQLQLIKECRVLLLHGDEKINPAVAELFRPKTLVVRLPEEKRVTRSPSLIRPSVIESLPNPDRNGFNFDSDTLVPSFGEPTVEMPRVKN